jgi:hypothetical protein
LKLCFMNFSNVDFYDVQKQIMRKQGHPNTSPIT